MHNGLTPFIKTTKGLAQHRANGGTVILVTNAPRTSREIQAQLGEINVGQNCYDAVVTSGDVTRALITQYGTGCVFHIGPARDNSLFDGLDVQCVDADRAGAIVCTGLFDEFTETPSDYNDQFRVLIARGLPMICANPDRIVRKGNALLHCAGALADIYKDFGGTVYMAGKPYAPIYDLAMLRAAQLRNTPIKKPDILAIGDGPETDVQGAADFGIPVVLIAGGINHHDENLEEKVRKLIPHADIVATRNDLSWDHA